MFNYVSKEDVGQKENKIWQMFLINPEEINRNSLTAWFHLTFHARNSNLAFC